MPLASGICRHSAAASSGTRRRKANNPAGDRPFSERSILMNTSSRHSQLLPWYIGLAIIAVVDAYIGYLFFTTKCEAPGLVQILVLVIIPGIYLILMYLTFKSQP